MLLPAFIASIFAFSVNIPFGYIRQGLKKFSVGWFLAVHFPVPLVVLVRWGSDLSYWFIPMLLIFSVLGQYFGGKIKARRQQEVSVDPSPR